MPRPALSFPRLQVATKPRASALRGLGGASMLVVLGLAVVAVLAQGLGRRRGARADASGLGERLPEVTSSGADSAASSPHRSEFDAIEAELQQMLADAPDEPVTRGRPD